MAHIHNPRSLDGQALHTRAKRKSRRISNRKDVVKREKESGLSYGRRDGGKTRTMIKRVDYSPFFGAL